CCSFRRAGARLKALLVGRAVGDCSALRNYCQPGAGSGPAGGRRQSRCHAPPPAALLFLICLTARPTAGICDRRNGFRETVELVSPLMSALGQFARRGPSAHVKAIYMSWKYRSGGPRGYHHGNLKEALLRAALELIAQKGPAA